MLAGGLVGVAAPAQALPPDKEICGKGVATSDDYEIAEKTARERAKDECEKAGFRDVETGREDPNDWRDYWYNGACGGSGVGYTWTLECTGIGIPGVPVDDGCESGEVSSGDDCLIQKIPPPPPCWDASINNCPVGGALRFTAPKYAMVGVPVTMYAYASWRPDANAPSQPTNGTAVIRVDGEDYSGVEFKDGVAEWRFIPETEGMKEFTASGVLFSGLSGANAYIDTVPARTYVLEYDPAAYAKALKKKAVEVGETYVITDPNQARSYVEDRYEWSVSEKSDDVCAVYETKKGAVKAKFNGEGKCTVIWMDKESGEEGKYTFVAKK